MIKLHKLTVWGCFLAIVFAAAQPTPVVWAQDNLKQLLEIGRTLARKDKHQEAIRVYKQALEKFGSADAAYNLAVLYDFELSYKAKALNYYKRFLALEPDTQDSKLAKQRFQLLQETLKSYYKDKKESWASGSNRKALRLLEIIKPAPDGEIITGQGNDYLEKGDYRGAIPAYQKAIVSMESTVACFNLATLYDYDLKYYDKAIYYYQRLLGMNAGGELADIARSRLQVLEIKKKKFLSQPNAKPYQLRGP